MSHWYYLSIAIVAEVLGTSFLKAADGFSRLWPSVVVMAAYLLAFYFLSLTLKTLPVGIAYAVWSGVGVALIGIALIVAGVVVINLLSASARGG